MNKFISIAVVAIIALGGAWWWGAHGRWAVERSQQESDLRQDLLEGRADILDARVDLYNVNFGEASRHLEMARGVLRRADDRLKVIGLTPDSTQLEVALTRIDDAQHMAAMLDQGANARAGDAAKIVADLLDAASKR